MKCRFLLNIVIGECATILELLASKDEALLIGRNSLLVLDLCLHVVDGVGRFDLKSDSFPSQPISRNPISSRFASTRNRSTHVLTQTHVGKLRIAITANCKIRGKTRN